MKTCPTCNKEFPDDVNFCKYDGTKLVEKNAKTESEKKCPKCGTPAVNGAKFCHMCGSPLTAETKNSQKRKTAPEAKSNYKKEINESGDVESLFNLDFIEIPELHIKMLRTPVTKEMFKSVKEELRRAFERDTFDFGFSWYDTQNFCSALSRLSKSPSGKMLFRLPTNDEFDYVLSHKIPIHIQQKKEWTQDCKEQRYYRDFRYKKGQKDWAQDGASSDFVFRIVRSI